MGLLEEIVKAEPEAQAVWGVAFDAVAESFRITKHGETHHSNAQLRITIVRLIEKGMLEVKFDNDAICIAPTERGNSFLNKPKGDEDLEPA